MLQHKNQKAREGISTTFLASRSRLTKFLTRFLSRPEDIEDVVQETYLKAYVAEHDKAIEQPQAFLYSIAKNLALNELNRKSRQMTDSLDECIESQLLEHGSDVREQIQAQQSLGIYCDAVATLPEQCRRIYLLRNVHGLKHQEIADYLDVSLSTVEKNLSKGVLACRKYVRRIEQGTLKAKAFVADSMQEPMQ